MTTLDPELVAILRRELPWFALYLGLCERLDKIETRLEDISAQSRRVEREPAAPTVSTVPTVSKRYCHLPGCHNLLTGHRRRWCSKSCQNKAYYRGLTNKHKRHPETGSIPGSARHGTPHGVGIVAGEGVVKGSV